MEETKLSAPERSLMGAAVDTWIETARTAADGKPAEPLRSLSRYYVGTMRTRHSLDGRWREGVRDSMVGMLEAHEASLRRPLVPSTEELAAQYMAALVALPGLVEEIEREAGA